MINSAVLVINRSYMPVHITSVKRAFALMYQGYAKAVNEQYEVFSFDDWAAQTPASDDDTIGVVHGKIKVPRVIILRSYDRLPKRHIRFCRHNIFIRDRHTCQYCGKTFNKKDLNIDHVVPRSRGGTSDWENVVCSCQACNHRKGGKTPQEANMKLLKQPAKPKWTPYMGFKLNTFKYEEWTPFLDFVDQPFKSSEIYE